MFGKSPALDYLGISPSERHWATAVDLAAYRVNGMPGRERPDLVRTALAEAVAWATTEA